ncbi:hypothetical protein QBC39DRAFT_433716 [Podospora conica]|nr:hypothetical protein QBC39DRAFT_433716 [Schizothecium conicum]
MDSLSNQEYRIRDLPTKSVTLFPTRAQIVREIKNVTLRPGPNEITVVGLTPTTDRHSIKVEGTGSAIITDITVELLPNRDIFEDIYPDSDSDKEDSDQDDDDVEEKTNTALEEVKAKIQELTDDKSRASEAVLSAASRLKFLDAYGNSLSDPKRSVDIEVSVETYRKEREKVFGDHISGSIQVRELSAKILDLEKEKTRLDKLALKESCKAAKAKARVERAKAKLREKESRRELERLNEKKRIRKERESFWPRSCYSVRITLEATNFTPSSSRRSSIASVSDVTVMAEKATAPDGGSACSTYACDLSLSYVTGAAFWSPSYDLALSTTASTAMLCFDAQLTNMTSETWSNSKVTLSTSQTTFADLQDAIPTLTPWRVKLGGRSNGGPQNDLLASNEERKEKGSWQATQAVNNTQMPREQLFGLSNATSLQDYQAQLMLLEQQNKKRLMMARVHEAPQPQPFILQAQQQAQQQQQQQQMSQNQAAAASGLFSNNNAGTSLFGGAGHPTTTTFGASNPGATNSATTAFGTINKPAFAYKATASAASSSRQAWNPETAAVEDASFDFDSFQPEPQPSLDFQESSFEETGLTATYDLPNLKTLKPSITASKQRVARLSFSSVQFSHTVIAKYRPVAYLKAKLRNASKLTLLKGPTGLTLDGTFLGRSTLPRCSAGDSFVLSLGVDPAIKVAYPKPEVKRSTTGVFTKGENSLYTRTVTLVNTRAAAGKPVTLAVLDQVPVSEDEKLRVDVQMPKGVSGGNVVATGLPGKEGKEGEGWGKATAVMKKGGEVAWDVLLNAGKSVRLTLEYDVAFPTGEKVVQC